MPPLHGLHSAQRSAPTCQLSSPSPNQPTMRIRRSLVVAALLTYIGANGQINVLCVRSIFECYSGVVPLECLPLLEPMFVRPGLTRGMI